ncbi:MAG: DUF11 domain-containing protein, partial [Actinobacteria bacterium]|nr:DUF11 domain-containing protein [Actinomycetota bacterium]
DLDNGSVTNTATAAGEDTNGDPVSGSDNATVTAVIGPDITVTKTAIPATYNAVGDVIDYTIVLENTGNVTLSNITVTDPLTGLTTTIAFLAPGASQTFNESYTITQADLDAGSVTNTATAAGEDTNGDPVNDNASATVTAVQDAQITVTKTANPATYNAVGDVIDYTIIVENTGNVTLSNINVTDPLTGLTTTIASLAPGASQTYNESYTITQADLDAGSVTNTVSAAGEDTNGDPVSDNDSATVNAVQDAQITVTKTANPATYNTVGDVIDYTIIVENTGNVTASNINVTDPLTGLSTTIVSLAPGASQTYNESYTITQADLDAGSVTNTASAAGEDTNGDPVSDNDSTTVNAAQNPQITVTKTANPATYSAVGDVIDYTIVVENTGNVTVSNITVEDPLTGLTTTIASLSPGTSQTYNESYTITQADLDAGSVTNTATATGEDTNGDPVSDNDSATVNAAQNPQIIVTKTANPTTYSAVGDVIDYTIVVENTGNVTITNIDVTDLLTGLTTTIASLAPGASQTFNESYTITQADLDAGSVTNTATADGEDTNGNPVSDNDSATVNATQNPQITVTKTTNPLTYNAVGDVIDYTIIVENTGNVTVSNITVTDPLTGLTTTIASLAPGASQTYNESYTITQADLDNGSVTNTATAAGEDTNGDPVSDNDSATVNAAQNPQITVTKTANPATYSAVGDVIDYTIVVENTGNVTVTNITVTDPLTGLSTTIASLAPGASQTYNESYTITQADLDNGSVTNTANAAGEDTNGDPVSDNDSATVNATQNPQITVTKTANPVTYSAVGDIIDYTIVVENTGNVTVTNITVTDPLTGLSTTIASLAPSASQTFNESYVITQADLDAGSVTNTATAAGEDTNGDPVTDSGSATVTAIQNPELTIT